MVLPSKKKENEGFAYISGTSFSLLNILNSGEAKISWYILTNLNKVSVSLIWSFSKNPKTDRANSFFFNFFLNLNKILMNTLNVTGDKDIILSDVENIRLCLSIALLLIIKLLRNFLSFLFTSKFAIIQLNHFRVPKTLDIGTLWISSNFIEFISSYNSGISVNKDFGSEKYLSSLIIFFK